MVDTWLVAGLGNPGATYERTRHNIGQLVADELAHRVGASFRQTRMNARVAEGWLTPGARKLLIVKPNSFMNVSGGPVSSVAQFYGLPADRVIVVHDELDIPFDTIRLKAGGGHGGHNGVRDVEKALGTADFLRVRVGIGRPPGRQDPADWVLSAFGQSERKNLPILVGDAADAVELIASDGLVSAQQRFHAPR